MPVNTSIFYTKDYILQAKKASIPFKRDLQRHFSLAEVVKVSESATIEDIFCQLLGKSKSEFRRKLKEGAIYIDDKKLLEDRPIEQGIMELCIGRCKLYLWCSITWRRKWMDYVNVYLIDPITEMMERILCQRTSLNRT